MHSLTPEEQASAVKIVLAALNDQLTPESLEQMRDVIPQLLNTLDANALSQDFQTPLQPTSQRRRPLRRS